MPEYISREAVLEATKNKCLYGLFNGCPANCSFCEEKAINATPAADVMPVVHAYWIFVSKVPYYSVFECSACHAMTIDARTYCTNCGAKMDVRNKEK